VIVGVGLAARFSASGLTEAAGVAAGAGARFGGTGTGFLAGAAADVATDFVGSGRAGIGVAEFVGVACGDGLGGAALVGADDARGCSNVRAGLAVDFCLPATGFGDGVAAARDSARGCNGGSGSTFTGDTSSPPCGERELRRSGNETPVRPASSGFSGPGGFRSSK
jgi:hypothetical protein